MTLPLIRNGFIVAWVLIFLQTMKELPATLLLRPVGFDTLAIRVWMEASEEYYQLAAPSALLIVLVGLPALILLCPVIGGQRKTTRENVPSHITQADACRLEDQVHLYQAGVFHLGAPFGVLRL